MSYAESTKFSAPVAFNFDATLDRIGEPYFEPSSGPMESLNPVYRQTGPGCTQGSVSTWRDTGHFLAMKLVVNPGSLNTGGGGTERIEVEIGLPSPVVTISGMTCSGHRVQPAQWTALAPVIYTDLHSDGFIRDWVIHGGEIFATSEWKTVKHYPLGGLIEDVGTATLRHTPR